MNRRSLRQVVAYGLVGVSLGALGATSFPLEWSASYATDVPYEVEITPAKLERLLGVKDGRALSVVATTAEGEQVLDVGQQEGRIPGSVNLRFRVPAGTTALTCRCGEAKGLTAPATDENLFAKALEPSRWQLSKNVAAESDGRGGVVLRTTSGANGTARCRMALPPEWAGKPAKIELDVMNVAKMTTGGTIRFVQYDEKWRQLPESVVDPRWTTHMRPPQKLVPLRERGRFHPQARFVELMVELRTLGGNVDEYGLPIKSPQDLWAALAVSRVAVRVAAQLPFPKYNDTFFDAGPSGRPGDTSLVLGGDRAFWYDTHSQGCWAEGRQFEDPATVFWPDRVGTVEAWLKPNWREDRTYDIFTASHCYNSNESRLIRPKFDCLTLKYRPGTKTFSFVIVDWDGKAFTRNVVAECPAGKWTHVALQWRPGDTADFFLDGKRLFALPLPDFEAWDLATRTDVMPNGRIPLEFYIGANYRSGRVTPGFPGEKSAFYPGAIDNLRVSSGCRYSGDFTPATSFAVDADTRALFTFDRSFDGVSGGGWGWIPGTLFAPVDRVAHQLTAGDRTVDYYPADNLPENDPFKVFSTLNYPVLPEADDFRLARRAVTKTQMMTAGEVLRFTCPPKTVPDFVEIANVGTQPLVHPAVVNKGEFDPRSFGDLADSLMYGREGLSDREKANAVFQFVLGASDYFMQHTITFPPHSDTPEIVVYKALMMLNGYCGFECGPLNNMAANLLACVARCPASSTGGYGHEFEQVFFDGKNHTYDLSAQKFFPAMDNETASCLGESEDQPGLYNRIGGDGGSFIRSYTRSWSDRVPALQAKVALTLNPGERFRVWQGNDGHVNDLHIHRWNKGEVPEKSSYREDYRAQTHATFANPERHILTRMDRFFPHYLNGFLVFDGRPAAANPAFASVAADSFVYPVSSCYPIVHAEYVATRADGGTAAVELSTDGGKTWRPAAASLDYEVRARTAYLVRVKAPIAEVANFRAVTEVMVNPRVHPGKVRAGANEMLFKATAGGTAKVTLGWREAAKPLEIKGGVHTGVIPGFEHQFVFLDPAKPQTLEVTGASPQARVRQVPLNAAFGAAAKVQAALAGGRLSLAAVKGSPDPAIACVRISDGDAQKDLYVLVTSQMRYVPANQAQLAAGARREPATAEQIQETVRFAKSGEAATFPFAPVAAGDYTVFMLDRFASDVKAPSELNRSFFRVDWKGKSAKPVVYAGSAGNQGVNLYKARYGNLTGRAQFKWDYVLDDVGYHPYFPRYKPRALTLPAGCDAVTFTADENRASGVELAAVVVVPQLERAFFCAFVKLLCGMNCDPARVSFDVD